MKTKNKKLPLFSFLLVKSMAARKNKNSQSGVTLLLAILILAAILAISFSLATILLIELQSSGDLLRTEGALYGANGVGEQALFNLKRGACPGNSASCYTSQFNNSVALQASPSIVTNANPIFTDKVTPGTNITNTPNKYDFCNVTQGSNGCNFGKVTVNYITTNQNNDPLYVYLCQWDPSAPLGSNPPPCTDTGTSQSYWLAPSSGTTQQGDSSVAPGSAALSPTINTVSWNAPIFNSSLQQELIVINPSGSNNIYFSVSTFAADGVTPEGLPYVGKTAVDVATGNGDVGRKIQVVSPNLSSSSSGSANGFAFNRQISINSGQVVGGAPLSSFPVLVSWIDSSLKSSANGGHVQSNTGTDIVFTSDSSGNSLIPYEQESYNPNTGQIAYWVNIASLSNSSTFYMFYGKSGASDQSNKNGVWSNNYKAVYHMDDASYSNGATVTDSTSNGNNMQISAFGGPAAVSSSGGQVANSLNMAGSNEYNGNQGTSAGVSGLGTGSNTISGWFYMNSLFAWDAGYTTLFGRSPNTGYPQNDESIIVSSSGAVLGEMYANGGPNYTSASSNLTPGTWNMITLTWDGSHLNLYVNGNPVTNLALSNPLNTDSIFYLGTSPTEYGRAASAKYDEIEGLNTALSANWIATEYKNQSAPSSFYNVGVEQ